MKRLDQLTFLRFLAVMLVLIYHGGGGFYIKPINFFPISVLLRSAPTAVSFLYVLSGFVMSLVYYRPNQRFDVRNYWRARFVRIYPLYIISFLLVSLYYIDYIARIKAPKILVNIFVLQAWYPPYAQSFNYPSWSMTVEFFFYALFPFFTMWAYRQPTQKLIRVSLALWIGSQIIHYFLWMFYFPAWELFIVYFPLFHLNSFILGVVGGIWFLREGQEREQKPIFNFLVFAGSLILVAALLIIGAVFPQFPHDLQPMAGLFSPIFTVAIVSLALDRSRLSLTLRHPWLVALGETAYASYILQVPVFWIYKRAVFSSSLRDPQSILDITYLPLMILIGLAAHFYIDQPARAWLKNVLQRVSIPLLLLDLAAVAVSIYISFQFRFTSNRGLIEYRSAAYAMFWCAFIVRTAVSVIFNGTNPSILNLSIAQMLRPVLISVTVGSILMGILMLSFVAIGWLEGFPRSILLYDWGVLLALSLLSRFVFRITGIYEIKGAMV